MLMIFNMCLILLYSDALIYNNFSYLNYYYYYYLINIIKIISDYKIKIKNNKILDKILDEIFNKIYKINISDKNKLSDKIIIN